MTVNLRRLLLEFKLNSFQIITATVASAVLAIAATFVAWQLSTQPLPRECLYFEEETSQGIECPGEAVVGREATRQQADLLSPIFAVAPWVIGVLLGATAVSPEIERRTAVLAWTLSPSRRRWLARRIAALGLVAVTTVGVAAAAATLLQALERPFIDPLVSFADYNGQGFVLTGRGLLAFGIATMIGAWLGRVLPAIVVGGALASVAAGLVFLSFPYLMPAVQLPEDAFKLSQGGAFLDERYRLPDGRVVSTWNEVVAAAPYPERTPGFRTWEANLQTLTFGYPGSAAPEVSLREMGLTLGASACTLLVAARIVRRRRPY